MDSRTESRNYIKALVSLQIYVPFTSRSAFGLLTGLVLAGSPAVKYLPENHEPENSGGLKKNVLEAL